MRPEASTKGGPGNRLTDAKVRHARPNGCHGTHSFRPTVTDCRRNRLVPSKMRKNAITWRSLTCSLPLTPLSDLLKGPIHSLQLQDVTCLDAAVCDGYLHLVWPRSRKRLCNGNNSSMRVEGGDGGESRGANLRHD